MTSEIRVNSLTNRSGLSTVSITDTGVVVAGILTANTGSFSGNVSVGGTLTYEDVTYVDSVGIITAQAGIDVTGGSVGIGTDNPRYPLEVNSGNLLVSGSAAGNLILEDRGVGNSSRPFALLASNDGNFTITNANRNDSGTTTSSVERLRIDSSGRVLQGLTSAKFGFFNDVNAPPVFQIQGDTYYDSAFSIFRDGTGASGPNFILAKGREAIVQDNDVLGTISFQGHDGTTELIEGASIVTEVDGTPAANNVPSALVFKTNSGTSITSERLRITSAGEIGIGNNGSFGIFTGANDRNMLLGTGSGSNGIQLYCSTTGYGGIYFGDSSSGNARYSGYVEYKNNENFFRIATAEVERLRIDSAGRLGLNQTSINSSRMMEIEQPASYTSALRINTEGSAGNPGYIEWFSGVSNYKMGVDHNNDSLKIRRDGAEKLRIDSNGRLLLGSTSTQGSTPSTMQIKGAGGTAIGVTLISGNDENAGGLLLDSSATNSLRIDADPDDNRNDTYIRFATDGTTRARIDSHGIKFGSDTAQANALDDYEEGSWTPNFSNCSYTPTVQFGRYTKIGRYVYCTITIDGNSMSGSGTIGLEGLPFSSTDVSDDQQRSAWHPANGGHMVGLSINDARFRVNGSTMQGVKGATGNTSYMSGNQLTSGTFQFTGDFSYYTA